MKHVYSKSAIKTNILRVLANISLTNISLFLVSLFVIVLFTYYNCEKIDTSRFYIKHLVFCGRYIIISRTIIFLIYIRFIYV